MNFYRLIMVGLFWCWMGGFFHPTQGRADSIPTTVGLDLNTVYFEVISPPEMKDRLVAKARDHFAKYEFPPPSMKPLAGHSAILQLRLTEEPVGKLCPTALLYEPVLVLTEEVLVPRKSRPIQARTWSSQAPLHTIEKAQASQVMEADGEEFIEKFIGYNRLSRGGYSEYYSEIPIQTLKGENKSSSPVPSSERLISIHSPNLQGLKLDQVKFSTWAGKYTSQIDSLAKRLTQEEGLLLVSNLSGPINKQLNLKLSTWPAQTACPHVLIYEAKLQLSEQVQIKRNGLSIMADTWSRRKVSIVKELDIKHLKADASNLMAEFIADYTAVNPKK